MTNPLDTLHSASTTITAGDNQLKNIAGLIAMEDDLNREVETAEAMLSSAKQRRYELRRKTLPEAMLAAQMTEFVAESGVKAQLKWDTEGSLGSPRTEEERLEREAKLDAICEHGGDEIVKMSVIIEFPKGQFHEADAWRARIAKQLAGKKYKGKGIKVAQMRTVNHQTLMGWIRERMSADAITDRLPQSFLDRIGVWYGQVAKIVRPKEPRS